jgi:hypothetical protein
MGFLSNGWTIIWGSCSAACGHTQRTRHGSEKQVCICDLSPCGRKRGNCRQKLSASITLQFHFTFWPMKPSFGAGDPQPLVIVTITVGLIRAVSLPV